MSFLYALVYLIYVICAVPVTAIVTFAIYALALPGLYFLSLGRVLIVRPPSLSSPKRTSKVPPDADPAVLQYFYGPAVADADQVIRLACDRGLNLWQRGGTAIGGSFKNLMTAPLGAGGAIGMAAGTALGTAVTAGLAVIQLITVGISAALVRVAATALRGFDSAILRIRNIRMICPTCYERVPYPAYECPGQDCPRRHRDVRPGRFGMVRRRCQCGTRMNTLLLFGSARMNAYCPHCGHSLEHRPGRAQEIVLPFFGATGAGKTRLLFSMVTQLRTWSGPRLAAEFGDTMTTGKLNHADRWLSRKSSTDKTPVELPRAYIIRLSVGHDTRILHMFDAAGELFYTPERTQELRYLDKAETFILVIDPLSVEAFWDRLPSEERDERKAVRSTAPSPDLAYQQAHQEIEAMGVPLRKARLAVVFSRADLIDAPGDDVAAWARDELGLGNLVRSARLHFSEACFFRTAAVMDDGAMHESVPALMRWVLARNGVSLPGDTS